MMPIGIERCGFLASSPVERQKAASVPAPWYSTGQLAPEDEPQQGLSMAAWGWAAAGRGCRRGRVPRRAAVLAESSALPRAEAHGCSPSFQACSCLAAGLVASLAVPALCPLQQLPLPAQPAECGSSAHVGTAMQPLCPLFPGLCKGVLSHCTALPSKGLSSQSRREGGGCRAVPGAGEAQAGRSGRTACTSHPLSRFLGE